MEKIKKLKGMDAVNYREYKKIRKAKGPFIVDPETDLSRPFMIRIYRRKPLPELEITNSGRNYVYDPLEQWLLKTGQDWYTIPNIYAYQLKGATMEDWERLQMYYKKSKAKEGSKNDHPFYCELPDVRGKCALWDYVDYEQRNHTKLDMFDYYNADDFVFYAYPSKYVYGMDPVVEPDPEVAERIRKKLERERATATKLENFSAKLGNSFFAYNRITQIIGFIIYSIYLTVFHPVYFAKFYHSSYSGCFLSGCFLAREDYLYDPNKLLIRPRLRKEAAMVGIYDLNDPVCRERNRVMKGLFSFDNFFNRMRARFLGWIPGYIRVFIKIWIILELVTYIYGRTHGYI